MIAGQLAGDAFELLAIEQRMLDHDEKYFEFDGNLRGRRQHDDERALLLACDELGESRLHDFGACQKAVEIVEYQVAVPLSSASAGKERSAASGSPAPDSLPLALPTRRPLATSQTAIFHCCWRACCTISRSASSGFFR